MTTISFEGGLGSGKTLGMTFFLGVERDIAHKTVYANYPLHFDHFELQMGKLLADMDELQDVAIGIDEFHIFCDSRVAASKKNLFFSYFATQTRKRNVSFYFTSQFLDQVDKRIRRLVDYRIMCETLGGEWFRYVMYDLTQMTPRTKTFYLYGPYVYGLYSTDKVIDVFSGNLTKETLKKIAHADS
jgi:hypothetical protein